MKNNTIKRTLMLAETINLVGFFEKFKEEKIKSLKIRDQWNVLSNIKELTPNVTKFNEFREKLTQDLSNEYFGSDVKSEEVEIPQTDEDGNNVVDENGEVQMQQARRVKEEYMESYNQKVAELNTELQNLLLEKTTYTFKPIDLDEIVDNLDGDTNIELQDIEMLSFCDVNSADNGDE